MEQVSRWSEEARKKQAERARLREARKRALKEVDARFATHEPAGAQAGQLVTNSVPASSPISSTPVPSLPTPMQSTPAGTPLVNLSVEALLSGKIGPSGFDFSKLAPAIRAGASIDEVAASMLIPAATLSLCIRAEGLSWSDFQAWGARARVASARQADLRSIEKGDTRAISMALGRDDSGGGDLIQQYMKIVARSHAIYGQMSPKQRETVIALIDAQNAESREVASMATTCDQFGDGRFYEYTLPDTCKLGEHVYSNDEAALINRYGFSVDQVDNFRARGIDPASIIQLRAAGVLPKDILKQVEAGTFAAPVPLPLTASAAPADILPKDFKPDVRLSVQRDLAPDSDLKDLRNVPDILD